MWVWVWRIDVWGGRPDKKRHMWVGADVLGLAPGAPHPHMTQLRCSGHGASRVALQHRAEGGEWATVRVYSIGEEVGHTLLLTTSHSLSTLNPGRWINTMPSAWENVALNGINLSQSLAIRAPRFSRCSAIQASRKRMRSCPSLARFRVVAHSGSVPMQGLKGESGMMYRTGGCRR